MSLRHLIPAGLLFVFLWGCAPEPLPPPLYPVAGTISQNGNAVTEGGLILIPESGDWGGLIVNASVKRDGTFTAETSRTTAKATTVHPGAPAGRYQVAYHAPSDGQKVGAEYHFPESIVLEAKENTLTLILPDRLPGAAAKKRDEAVKPDPKHDSKSDD